MISILSILLLTWSGPGKPGVESSGFSLAEQVAYFTQEGTGLPENLADVVDRLDKKRQRMPDDAQFLRQIFYHIHGSVLKEFRGHATFADMLQKGRYNCLTATTLFALLLQHYNMSYQIQETNHHIFILVQAGHTQWLIETTDPENGLISHPQEIQDRIDAYRKIVPAAEESNMVNYVLRTEIFRSVTLEELRGMEWFNLAVEAHNQRNLKQSIYYLQQAVVHYTSPRIDELVGVLWLWVDNSTLEETVKNDLKRRLLIIHQMNAPTVAVVN
jgi:hypothetical protein